MGVGCVGGVIEVIFLSVCSMVLGEGGEFLEKGSIR